MFLKTGLAGVALFAASFSAVEAAGLAPLRVGGDRPLSGHVVYPSNTGEAGSFGGNAVFLAEPVTYGADATPGRKPLVLLSHGIFGNRLNQLWLARRLADAEYVSVAIDHPGSSTRSRSPELARRLWERPLDLGRMIDGILADPSFGAMVDENRIFAVGHSLGGYTVLAAAGARADRAQFAAFCAGRPVGAACAAIEQLGINDPEITDAEFGQDVSEPRLKAIVALDPGGAPALTEASLSDIRVPVLIIGAGRTPEILNPEFESELAAGLIAGAEYLFLESAGHFDFLGLCIDMAKPILASENPADAIICDGDMVNRAAVHEFAAQRIIAFLNQQ